jgi:NADPH-dependent 2,4-dienoyl-CoA reductase/sulfur reductase-like enzyme
MSELRGASTGAAVVIVGCGHAGGRAAEALRLGGHSGPITVIGDEPHVPYERPALSKQCLLDSEAQVAWVRPEAWYDQAGIKLLRRRRVTRIDRTYGVVELDDHSLIAYQFLILTTGTRPRPLVLDGADHPLVCTLRTLEEAQRLQRRLKPGARVVVIGAGFIGMEVTATAVSRGCAVTVLEVAELPMARGVPPLLGAFYAGFHREKGVDLHTSTRVVRITGEQGRALVHTDRGTAFAADTVVVGIGVVPNTELAQAAGLEVDNGVVVDEYGRTNDPRIYAAGDVTSHYNPLLGRYIRLESWQNAQNQAIAVARNILGAARPYAEVPWFWSDQFDLNLQIAGTPEAGDETVRRGILGACPVVFFHLRDGKLLAAVGINSARDVRFGKEIIALGAPVSAAELADPNITLASLCTAARRAAKAA